MCLMDRLVSRLRILYLLRLLVYLTLLTVYGLATFIPLYSFIIFSAKNTLSVLHTLLFRIMKHVNQIFIYHIVPLVTLSSNDTQYISKIFHTSNFAAKNNRKVRIRRTHTLKCWLIVCLLILRWMSRLIFNY